MGQPHITTFQGMAATLRSFQCPVPRPGTVSSTFPVRLASTSHVEFVGRLKADLPRSTSTPGLQAHMRWVRTLGTACEYRGCMGLSPFASGVPESGLWVAFSCGSLFVDLPQSRVVLASRRQEGEESLGTHAPTWAANDYEYSTEHHLHKLSTLRIDDERARWR
jgi:hypothetical protein